MKRSCYLFIFLLFVSSCSKEIRPSEENIISYEKSSLENFSILLSRAVYAEPELRYVIKEEAIQKKDYDFDVFYPFIKDKLVDGIRTFEEVLMQYDTNNILSSVLSEHPLLTILVPDWSWISEDCFSAEQWDCSLPDVGVSFLSNSIEHNVYWNGEYAFSMCNGEFSSAPILIVKDNDRLILNSRTKSPLSSSYCFYCNDFVDISSTTKNRTKSSSIYTTFSLEYETTTDSVNVDVLEGRTLYSYGICASDSRIFQRDHIYYGMTSSIDSGYVNPNYYETLYRFKLSPNAMGIMDDPSGTGTGNDLKTNQYYYEANFFGKATKLTESEIASKSWGEGAAELIIRIYLGNEVISKNVSVGFSDAFSVKKVKLRENYNLLGALKSRLYYLEVDNDGNNYDWLEPKWIDAKLQLFFWDLSIFPNHYIVEFEEKDPSTEITRTIQNSFTFATNITTSHELTWLSEGVNYKDGYGYGLSQTYSTVASVSIKTTQTSDNLGSFFVQYTDKIVLFQNNAKAKLKTYSTGSVDAQIVTMYE